MGLRGKKGGVTGEKATEVDVLAGDANKIVYADILKSELDKLNITGESVTPYSDTYAGLAAIPVDASVTVTYWTILREDDIGTGDSTNPQYPKGIYTTQGTQWDFAVSLGADVLESGFEAIPAGGQLESNKMYYIQDGDTPILPASPQLDDFMWVNNDTPVNGGYGAQFVGVVQLTATNNVTNEFVLPPATRVLFRYNGTAWTSALNMELSIVLTDSDDGATLRPGHTYTIISTGELNFYLLERPFSVVRVALAGNSTGQAKINQHPNNAPSQIIQGEDGTISDSYTILNINKGHQVTIKGNTDPTNRRWYLNAPWTAFESSQVVWHTDVNTDDAVIGRLNLYPIGSSITTHTPPTHVQNGRYSVAIGEPTGEVTGEIIYISNGVVGAGGAWVRQTEDQDTRILDNIEVGIRSSGTNAGSNISLTFVDNDGVDYPSSAWAVSLNLVQYSGGSATILTDKALYNGTIGVGRNKQGFGKFYYTGENPNGLSAIRIDATTATTAQNVTVTYQGTNYNDSFAALSDLNTPLPWTTIIGQNKATDQADNIVELTEYTEGKIISFREPDNTDPDYGTIFNYQVLAGQTILNTEVTDTASEAELIAIKPKLERFGIGSTSSEMVAYPGNGGVPEANKDNVYYLDETVGALPLAAANQDISISIVQANSTDTQVIKDASKAKVTHYRSVDTGAGFIWIESEGQGTTKNALVYPVGNFTVLSVNDSGTGNDGAVYKIPTIDALQITLPNKAEMDIANGIYRVRISGDWAALSTQTTLLSFIDDTANGVDMGTGLPDDGNEWLDLVLDEANDKWIATSGGDVAISGITPVDQQDNGDGTYLEDRGIFREQWGVTNTSGGLTFPFPFKAGSVPVVKAVPLRAGDNLSITLQSVNNLSFGAWIVRNESDVGVTGVALHWKAKGLKP